MHADRIFGGQRDATRSRAVAQNENAQFSFDTVLDHRKHARAVVRTAVAATVPDRAHPPGRRSSR
jgi:uncharacterized protein YhfF